MISVVIPALDEAPRVASLVRRLLGEEAVEVVVADGGSSDGTPAEAEAAGARVVTSRRGRAEQMNAGAAASSGEVLLFLHADTLLPRGFPRGVRRALETPGVAAGAFSFGTDSGRAVLRAIERLANWRGRRLGIVFGDQGIFLRRGLFEELGGFPEQPIMEDRALLRRAVRRGRVVVLEETAVTSARRWEERGVLRTSLLNVAVSWGYELGVSPRRLARWYRGRGEA